MDRRHFLRFSASLAALAAMGGASRDPAPQHIVRTHPSQRELLVKDAAAVRTIKGGGDLAMFHPGDIIQCTGSECARHNGRFIVESVRDLGGQRELQAIPFMVLPAIHLDRTYPT